MNSQFLADVRQAQEAEQRHLRVGDPSALDVAVAAWERVLAHSAFAAAEVRFRVGVLNNAGVAFLRRYWARGRLEDLTQGVVLLQDAVRLAPADLPSLPSILNNLGLALLRLADADPYERQTYLSRAVDTLRRTIALLDPLGADPLFRARTLYLLGRSYSRLGSWREAIRSLEEALETFTRLKVRPELARALLELGQLYHWRQDFESAYIYLKDALRLFRRLNDSAGIAVAQESLGNLALQTARPSEAVVSLREARQSYVVLQRSDRVQVVDDLLRVAHQVSHI